MDITALALNESTTFLQLTHPADGSKLEDNGKPVGVNVFGPGTSQFARAQRKLQNAALRRQAKGGKVEPEVLRKEMDTFLTEVTSSFVNLTLGGVAMESQEDFRAFYADPRFGWVRSQVDEGLSDNSNFLGESQTG